MRPSSCSAKSLKASVGPWNSSSSQSFGPSWRKRRDGGMVEAGIGARDQPRSSASAKRSPTNGAMTRAASSG